MSALGDRIDLAFMNTQVTRGAGTILVVSTGMATEVGHISGMLQTTKDEVTPLTRQLNALTNQILIIAGVALLVSIGIGLWRDTAFDVLFLTAISFSVSAIPTGLPAVVTAILSMGTQTLAAAGAIVKRLRSVETLGSTSAINSDKTGTLTLNQMTAVQMAVVGHRYTISGEGYSTVGQIAHVGGESDVKIDQLLLPMALCADAEVKDGALVGDPTEGALVVLAAKGGVDPTLTRERYPRVATLPFDAAYKFMATFHRMEDADGKPVVRAYVKGAPDQLLARAAWVTAPEGGRHPIDEARKPYLEENERLGAKGLRVMATGQRDFDVATFDPNADMLPLIEDLELLALVGIVDPPRPEARVAIAEAKSAGIRVRMITGDHAITAEAIARELGIEGRAITGAEFSAMSDDEADRAHRRYRRHRPRSARGQGPPGRDPAAEGPHRGHDRGRRERRAGAQDGRHRGGDGHHRDGGLQGGRGDDPDRRQLRDDRECRRAGSRALRQPVALHPVPDGLPVRLHRDVPRREHLQHPRRRPVPAAPDPLDQLHGRHLPGHRARLRQAARRPDGGFAAAEGRSRSCRAPCSCGWRSSGRSWRPARSGSSSGPTTRTTTESPTRWAS